MTMSSFMNRFVLTVIGGLLAACESNPPRAEPTSMVHAELRQSAYRIESRLTTLLPKAAPIGVPTLGDKAPAASSPASLQPLPLPTRAKPDIDLRMNFYWVGDAAPLLREVCRVAGLEFRQLGAPPLMGVPVRLQSEGMSARAVLRAVGEQAGRHADVVLNVEAGAVELRYAN